MMSSWAYGVVEQIRTTRSELDSRKKLPLEARFSQRREAESRHSLSLRSCESRNSDSERLMKDDAMRGFRQGMMI